MMLRRVIVLLGALVAGGCGGPRSSPGGPEPGAPPKLGLTEVEKLRAECAMLKDQLTELRGRNSLLAEELTKLTFLNGQLRKQLEAVGDAPRQRDQYKGELARQQILVEQLRLRVRQLEGAAGSGSQPSVLLPDLPADQPGREGQ